MQSLSEVNATASLTKAVRAQEMQWLGPGWGGVSKNDGGRYSLRREEAQFVDLAQETEEGPHLLRASARGDISHLDYLGAATSDAAASATRPAAGAWARSARDDGSIAHGAAGDLAPALTHQTHNRQ